MTKEAVDSPPDDSGAESDKSQSKRQFVGNFLKEHMLKGKLALEHAAGLGHKENVIPPGEAHINGEPRKVEIGWHPVAGFAGKWFAEKTGLGKIITEKINKYPDPTQHWAVLVGDYCHELWMDEDLHVIYLNEKFNRDEWHTYEVGTTKFSDEALRQTGEMVIFRMREHRPAYNLISNNCQNFATLMLAAIQVGAHKEFGTTYAIWQKATGKGSVMDLFGTDTETEPTDEHANTVQHAQQVMDENTTHLDNHHHA